MTDKENSRAGQPEIPETSGAIRIILTDRLVPAATEEEEQFRVLGTQVRHMVGKNVPPARVIAMTSATPGEGKTFCSINMAAALARDFHQKVLLIEADLRRPKLSGKPGMCPGMVEFVQGDVSAEEAVVASDVPGLDVMTAGAPVGDRATRYLGSPLLLRAMLRLREKYNYIIVDCPPALPVADVGVISEWVDHILLVIHAGETDRAAVIRSVESLDRDKIIGTVLNMAMSGGGSYGYRYRYQY